MIAKSGDPLLQPEARAALIKELLPLAQVVTPNLHEAAALAGMPVATEADMEEAARRIPRSGRGTCWSRAATSRTPPPTSSGTGATFTRFPAPRIDSTNTHGTGCTFSSAIAAGLARGYALRDAISEAKAYVTAAIREGFQAGRGVGALRHFVDELVDRGRAPSTTRCRSWSTWASCACASCAALIALLVGPVIALPFSQKIVDLLARPVTGSATRWCSRRRPRRSGCR